MTDRLLRRDEVIHLSGLSRSELYRQMKAGIFPRSVSVSSRAVRWRESEVAEWISSRPKTPKK